MSTHNVPAAARTLAIVLAIALVATALAPLVYTAALVVA